MRLKCLLLQTLVLLPLWIYGQSNLTGGEYFFDSDPGIGNGIPLPAFTASGNIDVIFSASASVLTPGMHILGIRVKDISNTWSIPSFSSVYVISNDPLAQGTIIEAEYFFDSDPGIGNGTPVPDVSAGTAIDVTYVANSSALPVGMHILGVRTRDNLGIWSTPAFTSFYVDMNRSINKLEYYVDTDPGTGSATPLAISPEQPSIDMGIVFSTTALSVGTHTIGVRVGRVDDNWSSTETSTFTICTYATADFTPTIACVGSPASFIDNSSNTLTGDLYLWDFDSNGTTDATTVGNTSFTYAAPGSYTATLTIDRSGCTDVATATVQVEVAPIAQAGSDQNICIDNTLLSANVPAAGETGTWSLISGSGTVTSLTDPASTFTNISSSSATLSWTVTNAAAGCSASDEAAIFSNLPISASVVSVSVSLGQTVNANVQSPATINAGDILTTTIITQPVKGTAFVLADGTIDYSPNIETVGRDTVVFQICNQCARCSVNNLLIDILNNSPVIVPDPITVTTGETVSLDLLSIVSDPNNNLDPASLSIIQQPVSGAVASIDALFNLTINYANIVFTGTDQLAVQACDTEAACSSNIISIEVDLPGAVDPPITVYNAVSPNGDGKHDFLEIENITAYPDNRVYIFNRWGDKVFETRGYDNALASFGGTANRGGGGDLPAGTYFYTIDRGNGSTDISGFLVLKK